MVQLTDKHVDGRTMKVKTHYTHLHRKVWNESPVEGDAGDPWLLWWLFLPFEKFELEVAPAEDEANNLRKLLPMINSRGSLPIPN